MNISSAFASVFRGRLFVRLAKKGRSVICVYRQIVNLGVAGRLTGDSRRDRQGRMAGDDREDYMTL